MASVLPILTSFLFMPSLFFVENIIFTLAWLKIGSRSKLEANWQTRRVFVYGTESGIQLQAWHLQAACMSQQPAGSCGSLKPVIPNIYLFTESFRFTLSSSQKQRATCQLHATGILQGFQMDLVLDSDVSRLRADTKNACVIIAIDWHKDPLQ